MIIYFICFVVGVIVGALVGFAIDALCVAAKSEDLTDTETETDTYTFEIMDLRKL